VKHAGLLLALTIASVALPSLAWAADADPQVQELIQALCGPDAAAEWAASRKLLDLGDGVVMALAQLAGSPGPLPSRLVAIELLGQIGTAQAVDALLGLLPKEKDLALRGQLCMQIGSTRDTRAIPIIAEWLKTISPKALDDVPLMFNFLGFDKSFVQDAVNAVENDPSRIGGALRDYHLTPIVVKILEAVTE